MIRALVINLAALCVPFAALAERSMTCVAYSVPQPELQTESVSLRQDDAGHITMLRETLFFGPFFLSTDPEAVAPTDRNYTTREILFADTTDNVRDGNRFTLLNTVDQIETVVYVPMTWLIDWAAPSLKRTYFDYSPDPETGTYAPNWVVLDMYECEVSTS